MARRTIHFIGLLENTDSSVLNINLEHGFKLKSLPRDEGLSFFSELEGQSGHFDTFKMITADFGCLNNDEQSFQYVTNSFEGDIEFDDKSEAITKFPQELSNFNNTLVSGYLVSKIRLMRLFKEGDIRMPLRYYFLTKESRKEPFYASSSQAEYFHRTKYNLSNADIPDLQHFIQNTSLPFEKIFLELAFENFELSYKTNILNLAFLCLMISLEALLNPGDYELRYRISRNTAVLLGKNREESDSIFKEIRKLYDKRSKLVHTGDRKAISQEDVLKLRDYVRKSIKKIQTTGSDKQNLIDALNAKGFGARP